MVLIKRKNKSDTNDTRSKDELEKEVPEGIKNSKQVSLASESYKLVLYI